MPISIDFQDNSMGIVKSNKSFAAPVPKDSNTINVGDTVQVGNLAVGDIFNISGIDWVVVAKNHEGYPDGSVTVRSKDVLEQRAFDTKNSNHWGNSSLRAYLNGEFYNKLSEELKANILETHLINTDYYTDDKIFLPSFEEIGLRYEDEKPVGNTFNAFHDDASRVANFCEGSIEWFYWSRVPYSSNTNYVCSINDDGSAYDNIANDYSLGVCPILNLKSETPIIYIGKHEHIKLDDKEAPTIEVTSNTSEWTNKDFTVNVKAVDNNKVKSIKMPNGIVVTGDTGTFTITKNDKYSFIAEDEAGNTRTYELTVSNINKEKPTAPTITRVDDSIKITEGTDSVSGIKQTVYKINNGNWADIKDFDLSTLVTGQNTIYAKSIDKAGNESDVAEFKVTIEDNHKQAAEDAVAKAEKTKDPKDVEDAKDKIKVMPDGKEKDDLNNRLDEVQKKINEKKAKEQKAKEEIEAKKAVEKAEKTKTGKDIKDAEDKVSKLDEGKTKEELTNKLNELKKRIKAEKDACIKARNAVEKAKTTLDKEDYDYAQKLVTNLNTTIYKKEKAQLQSVLNALKYYVNAKEKQNALKETQNIRKIDKQVRDAVYKYRYTKDSKYIEEAQKAIDTLEESNVKTALQKRLDAANSVSPMQLAVDARKAVDQLDSYINYGDIVNNLDKAKEYYKVTNKAVNRLSNNSQYKTRMEKAKAYIEVLEQLAKYKENAEKNNILADEEEMSKLISDANDLQFTSMNKQKVIKEILTFQEQLKTMSETSAPEI